MLSIFSIIILAGLSGACSGAADQDGVKIIGSVEQIVPNGFVMLEIIEEAGPVPVDTVEIDSEGKYRMNADISSPSFFRLNFNDRQYVTLVLTGEEFEVEVNVDGNEPNGYSEVSGSYDTQYLRDMDEIMNEFQSDARRINQELMQARNNRDGMTFQSLNNEYMDLARSTNEQMKKLVWEAVPSLAAFYGLQRMDPEQYYTFFDSVSTELSKELPENAIVMNLAQMVNTRRTLAIGAEAPEISLQTPEGETLSLSSLRGNYVLVDFWAAWCKPCRAENPNIVRAYNEFKDNNFKVLGVSLDRTREAWLQAIEQDGLPWYHISDLKYWNSEVTRSYQISGIPASYLIDPDGKIIAKNLRGPRLQAKLKEIFG